jgi:hypothetical protein
VEGNLKPQRRGERKEIGAKAGAIELYAISRRSLLCSKKINGKSFNHHQKGLLMQ